MNESHRCSIETLKLDQQDKVKTMKNENVTLFTKMRLQHQQEITHLERLNDLKVSENNEASEDREREMMKCYKEEKEELEQKIQTLENKVSALIVSLMNGPDQKDTVMVDMTNEIDSLRTVVALKNEEIKAVTEENLNLKQKLITFDDLKDKVKNLTSQIEDLKELLAAKRSNERRLDAELQQIQHSLQKQSREKKRIALEKEQLEWRVRQGRTFQKCLEETQLQSLSFSDETQHSRRNFKTFHVRSPSLNNTEPLPSSPMIMSPPSNNSTPTVLDYRTSSTSLSYQLELSEHKSPDSLRSVRRRQRRLDTGLDDRQ